MFSFNPNFSKYKTKQNKMSNRKLNRLYLGWVFTKLEVRLFKVNHSRVDGMDCTMSNFFPSLNHLQSTFSIILRPVN